jgi:hypothetical protein
VSALPARGPAAGRAVAGRAAAAQRAQIRAAAPQVAGRIQRYLQRLAAFLTPGSVDAAENALRRFRPVDDHRRRAGEHRRGAPR